MLGERIMLLRRGSGWSQTELSRRLHISPSAVGMYEQGRREPSLQGLVEIAAVFGVSTDYLLTGRPASPGDEETVTRLLTNAAKIRSRGKSSLSQQEISVLFAAISADT